MGGEERAAGGTILVADDDPSVLTIVARMLERRGYETHVAASGARAEEILEREGRVDLIVADLRMPDMSGAELVRRARSLHPRVAAVYISGYTEDAEELLPAGTGVLEKPFTSEALLHAVGAALAGG
jgi:two-component system, cell cycle sensor histidine kinase and response regulator CckA